VAVWVAAVYDEEEDIRTGEEKRTSFEEYRGEQDG